MINVDFITKFFSQNPTIEQISARAIYLDDRAADHLNIAAKAHAAHDNAIAVHHNNLAVDLMDTADELRKVVAQAAVYLYIPTDEDQLEPAA